MIVLVVALVVVLLYRDHLMAAERLEAARERAELLNRLLHDEKPYVAPIVTPLPPKPLPGEDDLEPDGWDLVGTVTGSA